MIIIKDAEQYYDRVLFALALDNYLLKNSNEMWSFKNLICEGNNLYRDNCLVEFKPPINVNHIDPLFVKVRFDGTQYRFVIAKRSK